MLLKGHQCFWYLGRPPTLTAYYGMVWLIFLIFLKTIKTQKTRSEDTKQPHLGLSNPNLTSMSDVFAIMSFARVKLMPLTYLVQPKSIMSQGYELPSKENLDECEFGWQVEHTFHHGLMLTGVWYPMVPLILVAGVRSPMTISNGNFFGFTMVQSPMAIFITRVSQWWQKNICIKTDGSAVAKDGN